RLETVLGASRGSWSRVEKSSAAATSAAAWFSEMTGGGACPCMSPLAARLSIGRTVLRVTTTQRTLAAGPRSQQERRLACSAEGDHDYAPTARHRHGIRIASLLVTG